MKINFGDKTYNVNKISQYSDIAHLKGQYCYCGNDLQMKTTGFNVYGFVEIGKNFMVVVECKECFTKYMYHISTVGRNDIEVFKNDLGLLLHLNENSL